MFFPLSTNAPIYYYPFATVGLIVVNAALFFATIGLAVDAEHVESVLWLTLEFDKIAPLQWLTNNFMHASFPRSRESCHSNWRGAPSKRSTKEAWKRKSTTGDVKRFL